MKKEKYKAKCPGHVLIADPAYLEKDKDGRTGYEVIDYRPPPGFQMGILLEQFHRPFEESCMQYAVNLYFAPGQDLDRCMNLEPVHWQGFSQKWADTGNACYKVQADERQEDVKTEADGIWSQCQEFYTCDGNVHKTKAALITLVMPDDGTFEGMRKLVYSLFEEVKPVQLGEKEKTSGKEGNISIRGTLKELRDTENRAAGHLGEIMRPKAAPKKPGKNEYKKKDPER